MKRRVDLRSTIAPPPITIFGGARKGKGASDLAPFNVLPEYWTVAFATSDRMSLHLRGAEQNEEVEFSTEQILFALRQAVRAGANRRDAQAHEPGAQRVDSDGPLRQLGEPAIESDDSQAGIRRSRPARSRRVWSAQGISTWRRPVAIGAICPEQRNSIGTSHGQSGAGATAIPPGKWRRKRQGDIAQFDNCRIALCPAGTFAPGAESGPGSAGS